jgi:hypothetical protein
MKEIEVSEIRFHAATLADMEGGLLGWVGFTLDNVLGIAGVALRKTLEGRYTLAFPKQKPGRWPRFYVWPLTDEARRHIEGEVLRVLGYQQEAQP